MIDGQRQFLNNAEAAACLFISPDTLNHWRMRGHGPKFLKLGGRILYETADIDKFIDSQKRESTR